MTNRMYPWGHSRRYNAYSEYIRGIFGSRVQKISVDAGFTCPNRDGTKSTGGCTYCDNKAFNPSYCHPEKSILQQVTEGMEFHAKRYRRAEKFLVYFQPFSNTYASLETLKAKYEEAVRIPGVTGLVIGTRPDCIDDEKLKYLSQLAQKYFIQVEYGVETTNEETLQRINRCHTYVLAKEVIEKTYSYGIHVGAHFIFGLPGETKTGMMKMANEISSLKVDSVKFHQLQIVKGTKMEEEFITSPESFHLFTRDEYISFIVDFTERLDSKIVIERFTGEVPPRFIESHNWGLLRNDEILRLIEEEFERRDTWQGMTNRE